MSNDLEEILNNFKLTIIEYINSKNIHVIDDNGYKYKINKDNIKRRNKLPHLFRGNPYAQDNIQLYLDKNNSNLVLLSNEYIDCKHNLEFICKKHKDKGIQLKKLDDIVNGKHFCKYCGIEKRSEKYRIDDSTILNKCDELGLIYIDRFIKEQETWIKYKCKKHLNKGIQCVSWYHLKTCAIGCPYCTGRYKTTEDFIKEMKEINPNIEIIGEYNGSEKPIKCRCKICNHIWNPIGRSLKNNQGCPNCNLSKGEARIRKFLTDYNISFVQQKLFEDCVYKDKLRFDFYLQDYNMCIEFDGQQHFEPVDFANKGTKWAENLFTHNQIKDSIKNKYCKNKNIKLLRIPYWDIKNIENILASELSDAFLMQSL